MKKNTNNGKIMFLSGIGIQLIQWGGILFVLLTRFADWSFLETTGFKIATVIFCWLVLNGISIWLMNRGNYLMKEND